MQFYNKLQSVICSNKTKIFFSFKGFARLVTSTDCPSVWHKYCARIMSWNSSYTLVEKIIVYCWKNPHWNKWNSKYFMKLGRWKKSNVTPEQPWPNCEFSISSRQEFGPIMTTPFLPTELWSGFDKFCPKNTKQIFLC